MADWRQIEDDREKYAAYLCSREWAVLKEAVHKRSNGRCERCMGFSIDAVHHLSYERKYHEKLEDLQGNCKYCHSFTHGKSAFDPTAFGDIIVYLRLCKDNGRSPIPIDSWEIPFSSEITLAIVAIKQLHALMDASLLRESTFGGSCSEWIEEAMILIDSKLPFLFYPRGLKGGFPWSVREEDGEWWASALKAMGLCEPDNWCEPSHEFDGVPL